MTGECSDILFIYGPGGRAGKKDGRDAGQGSHAAVYKTDEVLPPFFYLPDDPFPVEIIQRGTDGGLGES